MMSAEQFQREKLYQATMSIAKSIRNNGLVTEDEYDTINRLMLEKYRPLLGRVMTADALI